jgi:glycosyltransferase involved in cell wall biosynthesis
MKKKKIKIGFIINYRLEGWLGVTNYYKNLFEAINLQSSKYIEIIIFTDFYMTKKEENIFKGIKVIKSNLFNRKDKMIKLVNFFSILILGKNSFVEKFLKVNQISVVSHTNYLGKNSLIPSIKWFPDFQELKYPENFSYKQKIARNIDIYMASVHSSKILLSSKSVQMNLKKINKNAFYNSVVLHHTTHLDKSIKITNIKELKKKYNIRKKFFYLPNHFWKHKNHLVVFKAIKKIKTNEKNICLIMTGNKSDYRFPNYFSELNLFIEKENLNKNIFHLGVVPINDVFSFIKNSIAVINPSFFEGWGNTLEHAINLKKTAIVSNIDVHRERISKNKLLFNPTDSNQLSKIMIKVMNKKIKLPKDNNFVSDKFIKNYTTIIKNTIKT